MRLAGTREFARPGAGAARRQATTAATRAALSELWLQATGGRSLVGVALAATGSLARGDSGPLSDLDLVLLHDGRQRAGELTALADRLWYPLWDSGLGLDHAVRSLGECRKAATADLTAAVGLLDLEHLCGDSEVVLGVRAALSHDWRANARKRLPELVESVQVRHERFGDVTQTLAPDLKEGAGGLRDMTVLRALTSAWLTDRPRGAVDEAHATLLDVRDGLQLVTGRGRSRLNVEDQDAVAALFGDQDSDDLLTRVCGGARVIGYALESTMRRAGQSQRARTLRVGPRRPVLSPLGYGLHAHDGEVVLGGRAVHGSDPLLVLRAGIVAARAGLPIAPTTLANLVEHAPALPQPWPAEARDLFCDLLASGPGLIEVWEALDQAGLVSSWLPAWDAVRSRPQRNGIHRFTVDRHSIETVVNVSSMVREVERPDLLSVAALLHDIGKVAGARDHSLEGEPVGRALATRLGFDSDDVDTIALLVREHLTLIELATRRDPTDPATVAAVRAAVGDRLDVLTMLRWLTEADARAAGEKAWTPWRASLATELFQATEAAMHADRLTGAGSAGAGAGAHARAEEPSRQPAAVPEAAGAALAAGQPWVGATRSGTAWTVTVVSPDRVGLFADTAGVLALAGLEVRTASVRTTDGVAVDDWIVSSPSGDGVDVEALARALDRLAGGDTAPLAALARGRRRAGPTASSRASSGAPGQSRVLVLAQAGTDATVLEVRAGDRLGLLHDLGRALSRAGLSVRSAHVATYAGQTLDTFYLTDAGGRPLTPGAVAQAVATLIDACDGVGEG
nr:[protein-PII] uridylyltransferase [Arsenicicoccus piscis]